MLRNWRLLLPVIVAALFLGVASRPAHAVGDLQLNVAGQSLNEVQLVLTDAQGNEVKQDDDSDRAAGYWWWHNRRPGTYTVRVMRNGQQVGQPQQIDVRDGTRTSYRVDASTGAVMVASSLPSRMLANFGFGLYGGAKRSPWDANVTANTPGQSNGIAELGGNWGIGGFEGRYYFSPVQQFFQGARLFAYGSYVHYFGDPIEKFFLNDHPTPGDDVGAGVDEKWSGIIGVGANFNIAQRLGLGLMFGGHMTRVETFALANETGGGGQNNRFHQSDLVFGPVLAAELFYPVAYLQGIGTLEWMLRAQAMWMPDTSVDGFSPNFGFRYHARAEGGMQMNGVTGFRVNF